MSAPDFKFSLSNYNDRDYRFIMLGNERVHYVANVDELYRALGYSDEVRHSGVLPDEFIWAEYRQPGRPQSPMCFQARLIEYLKKHSASFAGKYEGQMAKWAGCCAGLVAKKNAACGSCLLHSGSKS